MQPYQQKEAATHPTIQDRDNLSDKDLNKITQYVLKLIDATDNLYKPTKDNGRFKNPFPTWSKPSYADLIKFGFSTNYSKVPTSKEILDRELPIVKPHFEAPLEAKMKITWIGHATLVVQMDGIAFITDPIFSARASPSQYVGPKRYRDCPCSMEELPKELKAVMISHSHYDHLDVNTVISLNKIYGRDLRWFVPIGLGQWMKDNGCENVVELNWWDHHPLCDGSNVVVFSTPCQHWSKRSINDDNRTLWSSYSVIGRTKKFFFSGDTGYCDGFKQIGQVFGPFDAAAIAIGAYEPRWFMKASHVNPEEAVMIHNDIRSFFSIAMHWGTFALGNEFYLDPPRQLAEALSKLNVSKDRFVTFKHGETRFAGAALADVIPIAKNNL